MTGGRPMRGVRMMMAVLIGLTLASPAAAWWNKDWSYRKAVTVDTSPSGVNVSGAIGRTVVLIRLHSGNFTFPDALQNGADLRIVDSDDKTPLPFHIEHYDQANGLATLWVSVPNLNGGEKRQIWLYFGDKAAAASQDVPGTFDSDTLAAYHFGEGPGQPSADATANANAASNGPPGIDDSGIIGRSARFPGQGAVQVPASASLAMPAAAPLTVSAWVRPDQLAGEEALFARGALVFELNAGVPFALIGGTQVAATAAVKQGEWTHLAFVADGKTIKLYVNGVEAAAASAALPAIDGPLQIGGAEGRAFTGELDELRIARTARPPAMLLAMAQGEGPAGKLVSVAESAEKQSSGGGTLFFIASKVELVDGIVIGLCMLMLVVAIWVMVDKARYVSAAERDNRLFMKRFRQLHEELMPIAQMPGITTREAARVGASPIGRVYEMGIEELLVRKRRWGRTPLSGEAVEAMRAAVDAVVIDENQKLDKWMVLLTIAISGGPFIGLLGTVMGVMNTFGGVAMAGDVNVNAIAPGIAAALLATISGLAWGTPRAITVRGAARITDASGVPVAAPAMLGAAPLFVDGGAITLGAPAVLADSLDAFGRGPWRYAAIHPGAAPVALAPVDWNWTTFVGDRALPGVAIAQTAVTLGNGGMAVHIRYVARRALTGFAAACLAPTRAPVLLAITSGRDAAPQRIATRTVVTRPFTLAAGGALDFTLASADGGAVSAAYRLRIVTTPAAAPAC